MRLAAMQSGIAKVIVAGAGIGGFTTTGVLAKNGFEVTILEAHT